MAKVPRRFLEYLRENPDWLPLPLEPMHGWRSAPDEGGHTHCEACHHTIHIDDPVVGCYLEYISKCSAQSAWPTTRSCSANGWHRDRADTIGRNCHTSFATQVVRKWVCSGNREQ